MLFICVYYIARYGPSSLGVAVGGQLPILGFWCGNISYFVVEIFPHCYSVGWEKDKYRYCELEPCQRISPGILETLGKINFKMRSWIFLGCGKTSSVEASFCKQSLRVFFFFLLGNYHFLKWWARKLNFCAKKHKTSVIGKAVSLQIIFSFRKQRDVFLYEFRWFTYQIVQWLFF